MSTTGGMEFALFDILNILDIRVATFGDFEKFCVMQFTPNYFMGNFLECAHQKFTLDFMGNFLECAHQKFKLDFMGNFLECFHQEFTVDCMGNFLECDHQE